MDRDEMDITDHMIESCGRAHSRVGLVEGEPQGYRWSRESMRVVLEAARDFWTGERSMEPPPGPPNPPHVPNRPKEFA